MRLVDLLQGVPDEVTRARILTYLEARIVRADTGCWSWTGRKNAKGYGLVSYQGYYFRVHRLVFELINGTIPPPNKLVLDHLCRNRSCCNPDHLECVTNRENLMRGEGVAAKGARQTHCAQGHPFETYGARRANGYRWCKECQRIRDRKRHPRHPRHPAAVTL
jgi:HNH endonuclease